MALVSMRQLPDHAAVYGYGVPVEEIQEGIEHGVRNINIDTDICLAMTGATVALSTKPKVNLIRVNIGSGRHSLQNPSARRASKHLVLPAMRTRSNSCRWKPWQIDMPRVSSSR